MTWWFLAGTFIDVTSACLERTRWGLVKVRSQIYAELQDARRAFQHPGRRLCADVLSD